MYKNSYIYYAIQFFSPSRIIFLLDGHLMGRVVYNPFQILTKRLYTAMYEIKKYFY